jgi:hypothetical protein
MMRLKRYFDYIKESHEYEYRGALEEFPDVVSLLDLAVERTYEEVEGGMKLVIIAAVDKGYVHQVLHFERDQSQDRFFVLVDELAANGEVEDYGLYFTVMLFRQGANNSIGDWYGDEEIPEGDEMLEVLKDTLRYEFPKFDIR